MSNQVCQNTTDEIADHGRVEPHSNPRAWLTPDGLFVVLFVSALALLTPARWLKLDAATDLGENRALAAEPEFSWETWKDGSYQKDFDRYFDDHLGFRSYLIRIHHLQMRTWFGLAPRPALPLAGRDRRKEDPLAHMKRPELSAEQARQREDDWLLAQASVPGKQGWFYLAEGLTGVVGQQVNPWTAAELAKIGRYFERRQRWLAERNIPVIVMIVPDKHTVYPEYLPNVFNPAYAPRRYRQAIAQLQRQPQLHVVDLLTILQQAKPRELLYFKTDTHWTETGAFIAYQALSAAVKSLTPNYVALAPDDFRRVAAQRELGDLARVLADETSAKEIYQHWEHIRPRRTFHSRLFTKMDTATRFTYHDPRQRVHATFCLEDGPLPSAYVIHDSFMDFLFAWLAEGFRQVTYQHSQEGFHRSRIEELKPQLVILEVVERTLLGIAAGKDRDFPDD